jgi:mannose-6-phosphate isomerase-like protein (cupin superfamily)
VAGTSAFAAWQTDSSKSTVWAVVTASVGIGAAVLANALAFLDFGGRAEAHRWAAVAYKDILRDFEEAFGLNENGSPSIDPATLSKLKSQLSEVDRAAPTVPMKRGSKIEQEDYDFATTAVELARARLQASVARADAESKELTASGEVIEVWNDRFYPALSISRVLVKPGFATELHALDVDEWYVIIEGFGNVRIGSLDAANVGVGAVIAIPARSQRQVTNKGDGKNLVFYRIRSPRPKQRRRPSVN